MTDDPTPVSDSARTGALQLLLGLGLLGNRVMGGMAAAVADAELLGHVPIAVLADLALHGRRRPAEIQQVVGMTSGGVTKLLDRLEQRGLVTRGFGMVPGDRRAIVVELTPKGDTLATAVADGLIALVPAVRVALRDADAILDRIDAGTAR